MEQLFGLEEIEIYTCNENYNEIIILNCARRGGK